MKQNDEMNDKKVLREEELENVSGGKPKKETKWRKGD